MEQTNFSKFSDELVKHYQWAEKKIGAEYIQDNLNKTLTNVISVTSLVALGYFASKSCNHMLLGAGFAAGMLLSWQGKGSTLKAGAVLPMNKEGYFALQKVCLLAVLLQKNYAAPLGFLAGNAFFHFAKAISGR